MTEVYIQKHALLVKKKCPKEIFWCPTGVTETGHSEKLMMTIELTRAGVNSNDLSSPERRLYSNIKNRQMSFDVLSFLANKSALHFYWFEERFGEKSNLPFFHICKRWSRISDNRCPHRLLCPFVCRHIDVRLQTDM